MRAALQINTVSLELEFIVNLFMNSLSGRSCELRIYICGFKIKIIHCKREKKCYAI